MPCRAGTAAGHRSLVNQFVTTTFTCFAGHQRCVWGATHNTTQVPTHLAWWEGRRALLSRWFLGGTVQRLGVID